MSVNVQRSGDMDLRPLPVILGFQRGITLSLGTQKEFGLPFSTPLKIGGTGKILSRPYAPGFLLHINWVRWAGYLYSPLRMNSAFSVSFLCLSLLLLRWLVRALNYRKRLPLPPGPKGYPIIGNLLDMPKVMPWKAFGEWAKKYGGSSTPHII